MTFKFSQILPLKTNRLSQWDINVSTEYDDKQYNVKQCICSYKQVRRYSPNKDSTQQQYHPDDYTDNDPFGT